ncbi:hypothetical protein [Candidatus Brachybacter algidus]|uniref:hypothetical protein n=1 Tax=Candidatus Brachybacter algidus TaxID=2982024 RepID=UPI001D4264DC|nr:hypothetical protein [Candidatus Brachybacter algidus]MBK6450146.1 hypothetical protein [Candidatus Brachybacter algidus]
MKYSAAKEDISNPIFISACEIAATEIATAFKIPQQGNGIEKFLTVITNQFFF